MFTSINKVSLYFTLRLVKKDRKMTDELVPGAQALGRREKRGKRNLK